jgi:hypothetical protein
MALGGGGGRSSLADNMADSSSIPMSVHSDTNAASHLALTIICTLSLLKPHTKHAFARWLINPMAPTVSSSEHIRYAASLSGTVWCLSYYSTRLCFC